MTSVRWRLGATIFLLAAALRLVYWLQLHDSPFFLHPVIDASTYHQFARDVAAGRWTADDVYYQPPLYPYALGVVYSVFGPNIAVARLLQLLLGAVVCALTAVLARRLFGELAGWVAGLACALYRPLIFYEGELLNPILVLALNVAALLVLIPGRPEGACRGGLLETGALSTRRLFWAGLLLGLSTVTRSEMALFAALVAAGAVFGGAPGMGARLRRGAVFSAAFLLPIVPFTAHNVVVGGEWVPISSNLGINLYLGNSGDYDATVGIRPGLGWRKLNYEPRRAGIPPDAAGATSRWWTRRALARIADDPAGWLRTLGRKAWLMVGAAEVQRNLEFGGRFTPLLAALPGWGMVFPLAAMGLVVAWKRRCGSLLALYLLVYVAVLLAFFVAGRFRLPMVPVLAVFAGLAVAQLHEWLTGGRRRRLVAALAALLVLGAVLRIDPFIDEAFDEADGYYFLAMTLASAGQVEASAASYERAIAIANPHWDALFNLAGLEAERGALTSAMGRYRLLLEKFPDDVDSLVNLAQLLALSGRRQEALALVDRSAARPEALPELLAAAANLYLSLGRLDAAQAVWRRVEASGYAGGEELLAQRLARRRAERARLQAWLRQPPPAPQAATAQVLRQLDASQRRFVAGNVEDAEHLLTVAVAEAPGSAASWEAVGKLWFLIGETPAATSAFRRALLLDPERPEAYLGMAHALAGDPATIGEAAAALRAFLVRESEGPRADSARRALAALPER